MGWFDEQIRQREQRDQDLFEGSILGVASAVVGSRKAQMAEDERLVTKGAIDEILRFYHFRPSENEGAPGGLEEELERALRPHGLMARRVELSGDWRKDAYGPMLAFHREGGIPTAVLPGSVRGYWYRDRTGKKVTVRRKEAEAFAGEAYCVYRPLPLHSSGDAELFRYLGDSLSGGDIGHLVLLTLLVSVIGLFLPQAARFLTGFVFNKEEIPMLWITAGFLCCVLLSLRILQRARSLLLDGMIRKASHSLGAAVMMRILSLPASFFRDFGSGDLSRRCHSVTELVTLLFRGSFDLGTAALFSLLYLFQVYRMAPGLLRASVLLLLSVAGISALSLVVAGRTGRLRMEEERREGIFSYGLIQGISKIKQAGAEKRAFAKWARLYRRAAVLTYGPERFLWLGQTLLLLVSLVGEAVLYFLAVSTGVAPSAFIGFLAAFGMVLGAFLSLAGAAGDLGRIRPLLDLLRPILEAEPEIAEDKEILTRISGSIEMNHVFFRYKKERPYLLDDLCLKIRAGEYAAIVGRTGCGKSTLLRLLLGFETPERGAIYYDGKDLARIDLRSLRRRIGTVTQDGELFQGNIYSNIVASVPEATQEIAWEAAEMAGIAEDIRSMPMGMFTAVTEGGGDFSGGQKQRILIARAVAAKPKILIFDEATSALDNRIQRQVSEALDRLRCTRLVIAHRLSTIRRCDRILVMDGGRIVEDGTYQELLEKDGLFASLVERQRLT